jgi:hypothetical protein
MHIWSVDKLVKPVNQVTRLASQTCEPSYGFH